jgi:hypothetical protein
MPLATVPTSANAATASHGESNEATTKITAEDQSVSAIDNLRQHHPNIDNAGYAALERFWIVYPDREMATILTFQLAFAQVYSGFAAIFLTALLGYLAIHEFRQRQETPDLHLVLTSTTENVGLDSLAIEVEANRVRRVRFHVAISNQSRTVATWFMVTFDAPFLTPWIKRHVNKSEKTTISRIMHMLTKMEPSEALERSPELVESLLLTTSTFPN